MRMQRKMETSMRAQRLKVWGLEKGGADPEDIIIAKARYQGQLAEYKQFADAMGVKPHMERVYIDGLGRVAPRKTDEITAFCRKYNISDKERKAVMKYV